MALPKFAENVRNARKALGLSLRKVAANTSFTHVTIHDYEHGIHTPNVEHLLELCRALKVKPTDLLKGCK